MTVADVLISYPDKISVWNKALFIIIGSYFDDKFCFSRAKVMSVIDYKYVNSVDIEPKSAESVKFAAEIDVRNLKLLVRDERLEGRPAKHYKVFASELS